MFIYIGVYRDNYRGPGTCRSVHICIAHSCFICAGLLRDQPYDEQQVSTWTDRICEACMRRLVDLRRPYKYIGTLHTVSLVALQRYIFCT